MFNQDPDKVVMWACGAALVAMLLIVNFAQ